MYDFYTSFELGGAGDWTYNLLPGNYEIWRMNAEDISLEEVHYYKGTPIGKPVIDSYIKAFCSDMRYIALKTASGNKASESALDVDEYYLVDSKTRFVYGPLTPNEFKTKCDVLDFSVSDWILTVPKPEAAR